MCWSGRGCGRVGAGQEWKERRRRCWEVYKPAQKRRWGYYTLPILYKDRLVARLDPKLDRASNTLLINGFWLEEHASTESDEFAIALARFAGFLQAQRVDIHVLEPATLRNTVRAYMDQGGGVNQDGGVSQDGGQLRPGKLPPPW